MLQQLFSTTGDSLLGNVLLGQKYPTRVLFLVLCMGSFWLPGAAGTTLNCHKTCICASNIVSCSKMNLSTVPTSLPLYTSVLDLSYNEITKLRSDWTIQSLPNLHNLLLSHNGLHFLSSEAFVNVKNLHYLDLSSNSLQQVDEFVFEPLVKLEVLLLYNNLITTIDRSAFITMINLQKLYLSQNKMSRFPLELLKEKSRLEKLNLLDVSSNKIKMVPIHELQALPAWIKNGLYFHNNPLPCHCDLYTLLAHWYIRKLNSAVDFRDDYTCVLPAPQKTQVGVFELSGDYMNCSTFKEADEEAFLEQTLTIGCDTKHRNMKKTWLMPGNVVVMQGNNQSAKVLPDGSLQISPVRVEDSGTYTCVAMSEAFNETIYVVLKVHNFTMHGVGETLNTAYTTLVGCLASVVLVLMYLYLTPCRCFCCPNKGKARGEDSIHSSMLSVTPTHEDPVLKAVLNRHVAFIDSKDLQGQNGKLNPNGEEEDDDDLDAEAGSVQNGRRKKSVAESISSVFSDTPMVV
ncbi:amphoterin-induced protein 1 [Thalassophryne amazonica]|uniref:amphoterin-induced protein 1 n=1 Tax=Thalassophryne amazonica TaxID=390379 RepID=UPI001471742B|nr:amphoterin-induced protein 1 [Thalassophryne amazonica]XP_034028134.1 amphoterin-induced protein 1 [Thalassophryne amazonica]XP_034028135.1 amphoterin-induced protein 1 [Thalassophryne amazonica]